LFENHDFQTLTCTCQSSTYSPPESTHFFQRSGSILIHFSKKACGWRLIHSQRVWMIMRFILHALSALSEALTPLKHTGPRETLFPILLLESVVNFSRRDVFSNKEFDHNALFHSPPYLLFAHHSSNSQTGLNRF
jgi:hypothetical protein